MTRDDVLIARWSALLITLGWVLLLAGWVSGAGASVFALSAVACGTGVAGYVYGIFKADRA